jgi:uncharacterized repeat protein (TIGR03803 family)
MKLARTVNTTRAYSSERRLWNLFRVAAIATVLLMTLAAELHADGKATVLHTFTGGTDGSYPDASLTADAAGNLYGTTQIGGTFGNGTVFKLSPDSNGHWQFTVLHEFTGGADGANPLGSLVFDADGNAFLTASSGGANGLGLVLELSPPAEPASDTLWHEKELYSFQGGSDGAIPFGNVVFDAAGNLYGTTSIGGHSHINCLAGCGTIYRLSPTAGGGVHERVLHRFLDAFSEGAEPRTGLVIDAAGNLYGTTYYGGNPSCASNGCGTVFELTLNAGEPQLVTLLPFNGSNGAFPRAGVTLGGNGTLFSAATSGGALNKGTVFSMTNVSGDWKLGDVYSFDGLNGLEPSGTLALDSNGNLYGTAYEGGANDWGAVFQLVPDSDGWTENLLYSFAVSGQGLGANPLDGVILDGAGNLYLTTNQGGNLNYCQPNSGFGTVVEFSAAAPSKR